MTQERYDSWRRLNVLGGPEVDPPRQWQPLNAPQGVQEPAGVLTLSGLEPKTKYLVVLDPANERIPLWPRTLPEALPAGGFTFLLGSCCYRPHDDGEVSAALQDLRDPEPPSCKLLVGDQIYADVPPVGLLKWGGVGIQDFADRYTTHWGYAPYREFLANTGNVFTCDDHEWWNNVREFQPHIPWTWTAAACHG